MDCSCLTVSVAVPYSFSLYKSCLQFLNKCYKRKKADWRILHNLQPFIIHYTNIRYKALKTTLKLHVYCAYYCAFWRKWIDIQKSAYLYFMLNMIHIQKKRPICIFIMRIVQYDGIVLLLPLKSYKKPELVTRNFTKVVRFTDCNS